MSKVYKVINISKQLEVYCLKYCYMYMYKSYVIIILFNKPILMCLNMIVDKTA